MLVNILLGLVGIVLLILIVASTRPSTFRVVRTATINAPPEKIFPLLDNFRSWASWSPWERMDPNMQRTHSGSTSGVGAKYHWVGNKKVGEGSMEILESAPPLRLKIRLDFIKPFEGHNLAEFSLVPTGTATTVTWDMHGPANLMTKVMGLFMSMDQMIGKDFEAGLANLRAQVEG
ncbi:MAG: SRPBCC family protein [Gemmatimonadota bacterium]|nr:SRPBCC family protein [Gemmatimonadota bacterium]